MGDDTRGGIAIATDDRVEFEFAGTSPIAVASMRPRGAKLGSRETRAAVAWMVGGGVLVVLVVVSAIVLGRSVGRRDVATDTLSTGQYAESSSIAPSAETAAAAATTLTSEVSSEPTTEAVATNQSVASATPSPSTVPDRPPATSPVTSQPTELAGSADSDRSALLAPTIFTPKIESPPTAAPTPPPASPPATAPEIAPTPVPERRALVKRPPPRGTQYRAPYGVTDEDIELSIRRGLEYLSGRFAEKAALGTGNDAGYGGLMAYALLQGGLAVEDDRFDPRGKLGSMMLDRVAKAPISIGLETYSRGVRATCLALFNRPQDHNAIAADVNALVNGHHSAGAYGYTVSKAPPNGYSDNSNSQYGVLGAWAGADVGIDVPLSYWEQVQSYWESVQHDDGGWSYQRNIGVPDNSMTYAGLASLLVAWDFLASKNRDDSVGKPPYTKAIERGFAWLDRPDADRKLGVTSNGRPADRAYADYGQERVGLASGFKHIASADWYRETAARMISEQGIDGSWTDDVVANSFNLLFLSRGRHPILMNKLGFDGYWANRPRDLANLTPWVSKQIERPLNWQIVSVNAPFEEWLDAPILYIASHQAPNFTKAQVDKLRNYALAGGLIFLHTDGGRATFDDYVTKLAHELFPQYEFTDLRSDHPLYSTVFKLNSSRVPLRGISNGARLLLVHTKEEMAIRWQWRDYNLVPDPFRFAVNLHVYAAGKRDLRRRLQSPYVPEFKPGRGIALAGGKRVPTPSIDVARVQYAGPWDPEPWAWTRFTRLMGYRTGLVIKVRPVQWANLSAADTPFAHLTGMAKYRPTEPEIAAMKKYVEEGGVLFIDNCGPSSEFTRGLDEALRDAFDQLPEPIPARHPLLSKGQPGMENLSPPAIRKYALELIKSDVPPIRVTYAGKGTLLVSQMDVVSGLLGTTTWGIMGYAPAWCEQFMQNALFWTMDGQATVSGRPGSGAK